MKTKPNHGTLLHQKGVKKILLIMKLTTFLLILTVLQVSAGSVFPQGTNISMDLQNVSMRDVIREIQAQGEMNFFYNDNLEQLETRVSVSFKDTPVQLALENALAQADMSYEVIKDDFIVLIPAKEQAQAQPGTVSGRVTDEIGVGLPGASVSIKGTTTGVITNLEGIFAISVEDPGAVLIVSYVGYISQEITVGDQTELMVTLAPDLVGLEEIVVVGYGTQKKVNLTGSVGNITNEALEYKAVSQVSQALAGEISGVTVEANTGAPGRNQAEIRIRGLGTFSSAGNDPLILVDGIPSSLDNLNPNDIKSISVLKDAASASIYGSRAANGVILLETKRGTSGKMVVDYNGYVGFQKPAKFPEFVESPEYAELFNEYLINSGSGPIYTDEDIAKYRSGEDPDNYANVNHYEDLFTSGSGFQTSHHVSFSGGNENNRYKFSTGYLRQDGLIDKNSFKRYNFLLNVNNKLGEKLDLSVSLSGNTGTIDEPAYPGAAGGTMEGSGSGFSIITGAVRLPVTMPGRKTDGTYGWINEQHPEADMDSESFLKDIIYHFLGNAQLKWSPFAGFSLIGRIGYNLDNSNLSIYNSTMVLDATRTLSPSSLTQERGTNQELVLDLFAQYTKSFNDHNIHVLLGYNQDEFRSESIWGFRDNFPTNSLYQLNAGSADNMQNSGTGYEWALQSYFGRINYDYQGKYLIEANVRYDGSSRFPKENRWGVFPSVSAGWRISEENFFQNSLPWISLMKIRASWGQLGNQRIGNYPYQSVFALGRDYPFGVPSTLHSGAAVVNLANKDITWESTTSFDIGIDMSVFEGKLNLVVDYFDKTTNDILYSISTSAALGMTPSEVNAGQVSNKGWDFEVIHKNRLGDFSYNVSLMFSAVKNTVEELSTIDEDIGNGLFVGESLLAVYGYEADGLFVDQADVDSYPTQPLPGEPGLVRYKDINGPDGIPDGIVDATYDRKVIGSRFPKYSYGANLSASYKGFDILAQFAGSGGMERDISSVQLGQAFQNETTPQRWQVEDRWTTENPNANASHPKFSSNGSQYNNSTFWLINASYLRLKNLQIGYSFSSNVLRKIKISRLRLYVNAYNLFTIDNFYKGWDPEPTNPGINSFYPFTSVYTVGVNVSF